MPWAQSCSGGARRLPPLPRDLTTCRTRLCSICKPKKSIRHNYLISYRQHNLVSLLNAAWHGESIFARYKVVHAAPTRRPQCTYHAWRTLLQDARCAYSWTPVYTSCMAHTIAGLGALPDMRCPGSTVSLCGTISGTISYHVWPFLCMMCFRARCKRVSPADANTETCVHDCRVDGPPLPGCWCALRACAPGQLLVPPDAWQMQPVQLRDLLVPGRAGAATAASTDPATGRAHRRSCAAHDRYTAGSA